jgi:hypothetical protein
MCHSANTTPVTRRSEFTSISGNKAFIGGFAC